MPTTISITRGLRVMIIMAAVAAGAFAYMLLDFRGVSEAVDANARLSELRAATQSVHRAADADPPENIIELDGAITTMRAAYASAFDGVSDVLGNIREQSARSSVGASLVSFEAASRARRAGTASEVEMHVILDPIVAELDVLIADISAAGVSQTGRIRALMLVAVVAAAVATGILFVGVRFWRRRLVESIRKLESSDERFRRSLDGAADAVVILDSELRVLYANDASIELSGYEREVVVGQVYTDFWVDFDLETERAVEQLTALGAVRFTRDSRRADGTVIPVAHNVIALGDGTFLGVAHDETPRLRTLEALKQSEARFRTVVDTMQNALVMIGEKRQPIMVNNALIKLLGYSEDEVLAMAETNMLVHPDARGMLTTITDQIRAGERDATPFSTRLVKKDGGMVDVEGLLSPFELDDGTRAVLAEAKDVTEQLIAEQGLSEALQDVRLGEARLARAQQIAHMGSWELDVDTNEGWWSDEAFRLLAVAPQSLALTPAALLRFIHPDDRDRVSVTYAAAFDSGQPFDLQYRIVRADGEERIFSQHGEFTLDDAGHVQTAQGTIRDVTEDVRVRKELVEAQKLQAVGTLAAGIAHDFNNLLTVIGGHLTLALDAGTPPDISLLEPAKRASDRASELVSQLLEFARSGTIHQGEEQIVTDVRQIVSDAAAMVAQNLDPRVTLRTNLADRPLFASAESGSLDRVCVNLLFNARDALNEQRAASGDKPYLPSIDVTLRAADDDRVIELVITDNGIGMSEEVRSRAFEPFFSTKKSEQSTGLGLATTYGIVTRLGGTIEMISEVGVGTTFTMRIPMASAIRSEAATAESRPPAEHAVSEPAPPLAEPSVAAAPVTARLLLVDDEEDLLSFVATALARFGYETVRATNGPAALAAVEGESFDLILLDVNLGEMDGWEVLRQLLDRNPAQPVLMWSGVAGHDEAMQRGAVGLLPKPFDSRGLLDAIEAALRPVPSAPAQSKNGRR